MKVYLNFFLEEEGGIFATIFISYTKFILSSSNLRNLKKMCKCSSDLPCLVTWTMCKCYNFFFTEIGNSMINEIDDTVVSIIILINNYIVTNYKVKMST